LPSIQNRVLFLIEFSVIHIYPTKNNLTMAITKKCIIIYLGVSITVLALLGECQSAPAPVQEAVEAGPSAGSSSASSSSSEEIVIANIGEAVVHPVKKRQIIHPDYIYTQ
jgi:hypothetical protein